MTLRAINTQREAGKDSKCIQIDERFITTIQGKEFVIYAGLLDLAHQRGLKKLVVEILQLPSDENGNTAICKAVSETEGGDVFTDIGDANPTNTNKKIVSHIIRMASTRAKARCLRDLTNVGLCSVEELGDVCTDEIPGADVLPNRKAANDYNVQKDNRAIQNDPKASIAQIKAIQTIAKRHRIAEDILSKMTSDNYGASLPDLSSSQAADFIRFLQKAS